MVTVKEEKTDANGSGISGEPNVPLDGSVLLLINAAGMNTITIKYHPSYLYGTPIKLQKSPDGPMAHWSPQPRTPLKSASTHRVIRVPTCRCPE